MAAGTAHLPVVDCPGQARQDCLQPLDEPLGCGLFFGGVGTGPEPLPELHRGRREGMEDVAPGRRQPWIQQGGHRHEYHPLIRLQLLPVLQQQVVAVEAGGHDRGVDAQV